MLSQSKTVLKNSFTQIISSDEKEPPIQKSWAPDLDAALGLWNEEGLDNAIVLKKRSFDLDLGLDLDGEVY